MNFESVHELIKFAIEEENEAALFYEKLSQIEPNKGTKNMFSEFANEERKHASMLEGFKQNQQKINEYSLKWVPDMKRTDYMVEVNYEPNMTYRDILRLAIAREDKSLNLYNELLIKTDDDNTIKMFKILCQEEAEHKLKLETLYDDYMKEHGD
ncbi:MAG: ferritin family protein [Desulfobacterales bacterium]|nr:ferritin family protein [Desulfobacterales bacterium]